MNQSFLNRRIPGLFIAFLLIFGFFTISFVTQNKVNPFIHASGSSLPVSIRITNLSAQGFTISYTTSAATNGTITYQTAGQNNTVVFDDRDSSNTSAAHQLHYFTLSHLQPDTSYSFNIISGGGTYNNNGHPYSVKTLSPPANKIQSQIISGKIIIPVNLAQEAIVYATASGAEDLSTLVARDGNYSLDSSNFLSLHNQLDLSTTKVYLLVQADGQQASLTLPNGLTQTVPAIVIGNNYDFSAPLPTGTNIASSSGLPITTFSKTVHWNVSISSPQQGQAFADQQPTFSGTAAPNTQVTISIHSANVISTGVTANQYGYWQYIPAANLSPGQHTITITALDSLGLPHTLSSTFYVYASGGQFLVPSVEVSPTVFPTTTTTDTPIPSPTITPTTPVSPTQTTATPTATPTPTPTPMSTPTSILAPTATSVPTNIIAQTSITTIPHISGTPVTGSNSAMTSMIIALIPVILGGLLIYLSKGVIR